MKTLVALSLFLCAAPLPAPSDETASFLKDFSGFRYSLHEGLLKTPPDRLHDMDLPSDSPVIKASRQFLTANAARITAYRKTVLERLGPSAPDFTQFEEKEGFERVPDILAIVPEGKGGEGIRTILALQRVDPVAAVTSVITMALGRSESAQSLSEFVLRNSLAAPRITAAKKSGSSWTVYADYYDRIFISEFDVSTGSCSLEHWYVRKK